MSFLVQIFNPNLHTPPFPTVLKHAQLISSLKPWEDPALPSSNRPISLLDTIGKFFGNIMLTRIQFEVRERGLVQDERFGSRIRHSTSLQLARHVERITRSFGEKRLTGTVYLDVAKVFDTVWINGLIYKLTILYFPSYLFHPISSYLRGRTFEASFIWPRNLVATCRLGWRRVFSFPLSSSVSVSTTSPHPRTTTS